MKYIAFCLLALCLFLFSSCATITYEAHSDKPVLLSSSVEKDFTLINRANDKGKKLWLFWWLVPVGSGRDRVLDKFASSGGDAVVNITIHESYDLIDFIVQNWSSYLIGVPGITNSLNQNFQADIIKYNETRRRPQQ